MLPLGLIYSIPLVLCLLCTSGGAVPSLAKRYDISCLPSTEEFPIEDCEDALKLMENTPKLAAYEPPFYGSGFASHLTVGRTDQMYIPYLGPRGTNDQGDRFTIPRTYSYGQCSIGLAFVPQYSSRDGSLLHNPPDHDFVDLVRDAAKTIIGDCGRGEGKGGGTRVGVERRISVVVWKTDGPSGREMRRINSLRALVDCPFVNSGPVREGSVESCYSAGTPSGDSGTCAWSGGGSIDTSYSYGQSYCSATDTSNCCAPDFCRPVAAEGKKGEGMLQMMFGMSPGWAETVGTCLMATVASLGSKLATRGEEGYG